MQPADYQLLEITDGEFNQLAKLIYDKTGITLNDSKRTLAVGRLNKVVKNLGLRTFKDYYSYVTQDKSGQALTQLINRITTNHTFFNREPDHFDFLKQTALPELIGKLRDKRDYDFRMWCAASSTGEEPYMLAMILMEYLGQQYSSWQAGLLATDIDKEALAKAATGIYYEDQVQKLPKPLINKYFKKISHDEYGVTERLQKEVIYRQFNLMDTTMPFRKKFDVIFIRNVMIYFDEPTKLALVKRLISVLKPGGYLFIGHAESIPRDSTSLRYVKPAVYQNPG